MALDQAPGVRVNAIAPGDAATEFIEEAMEDEDVRQSLPDQTPLERFADRRNYNVRLNLEPLTSGSGWGNFLNGWADVVRSMSDESVLLDVEDGIATVTLNEPDMRNALTGDVAGGIVDAMDEIGDSDARCVVITGAGGSFSAGGDINAMLEGLHGEVAPFEKVQNINDTSEALKRVHECELPVIAKIDGTCFGAGANLAIACDVQVASEGSRISFGFRQVGLAVDTGTSYFLPRIVGQNKAQELVLTGAMLDADEAEDLGLFTQVYDEEEFEDEAAEYVDRIATGPTVALKTSKRLIRQGLTSDLDQAMTNEAAGQAQVFETHDHEEGATAFMEGRDPDFEGH
jgi:enoyl-CoA hydratase/carnithine racemase